MKITTRLILACINLIRPILGPRGVCIYHIPCQDYAVDTLETKPLYKALPLIFLRVLSCNPLTKWWQKH